MGPKLPKGIHQVILLDHKVYIKATREIEDIRLVHGNRGCKLKPLEAGPDWTSSLPIIIRPEIRAHKIVQKSLPVRPRLRKPYAAWLNDLDEWTLTNRQTMQLMLASRKKTIRLNLSPQISVPSVGANYVFRAKLAAHRAKARFLVTLRCLASGTLTEFEYPFSCEYRGGVGEQGYLPIEFTLPDLPMGGLISMSLCYDQYVEEDHDIEPFLFLADPHVVSISADQSMYTCEIIGDGGNGRWYQAHLDYYVTNGEKLSIKVDSDVTVLRNGKDITIVKVGETGSSVVLKSNIAGTFVFSINGTPAFKAHIGLDPSVIQIPSDYLDGVQKRLDVIDETGTTHLISMASVMSNSLTPQDVLQKEGKPPYRLGVVPQEKFRYHSLKRKLAQAQSDTSAAQISHALETIEGGYKNVKFANLDFPAVDTPKVSIVIPAHNMIEAIYLCLCSLLLAHNSATFEVIVVDDASTDNTANLENFVSGISVIRNEHPMRFVKSCNIGASNARGEYLVLLNNDVEVTSGWLDELIDGFSRFDRVGAVGSKLIYPDGRLQDAGGIVWKTGNPWNYGNGDNPWAPEYCYARQVDYLSGAALMLTSKIWKEAEGFSSYLEPMYFEDTDLSFKIRDLGYKTYFIPSSVVFHYEGVTSGTDVTTGFKKFQEINRPKFKNRWFEAYSKHGEEGLRPDLEKDRGIRGRILFIDYATPRPDRDAGSYAAVQEMRLVQSLGYKVTFLPQNLAYLGGYTEDLERMGVEVIRAPFSLSVQDYLERHGSDFDGFYVTRYYTAQEVTSIIRLVAPGKPILLNNADLHFFRELRTAISEGSEEKLDNARIIRSAELSAMSNADLILSYNESEHAVITAYLEGAVPVAKCPWVVEVPKNTTSTKERKGISFLGSYGHPPNPQGVHWFVNNVLPALPSGTMDYKLSVYGTGMREGLAEISNSQVELVGYIEEIAEAFNEHRVFVAPLLSGAGIKGKVISALAHGIPCVLSPIAAESIGLRNGHDCFITETPLEWAEAIETLMKDDELWGRISRNAIMFVKKHYSFEEARKQMGKAFTQSGLGISSEWEAQ